MDQTTLWSIVMHRNKVLGARADRSEQSDSRNLETFTLKDEKVYIYTDHQSLQSHIYPKELICAKWYVDRASISDTNVEDRNTSSRASEENVVAITVIRAKDFHKESTAPANTKRIEYTL
ncbi:hypothetical protein Tco_0649514 [Tanacetum coccineum]